jgi:hypothetical protein
MVRKKSKIHSKLDSKKLDSKIDKKFGSGGIDIEKIKLGLMIVIVVLLVYAAFAFSQMNNAKGLETIHNKVIKHDLKKYSSQYPRVSYVTDAFLQQTNMPFFKKAKAGDYLVEYVGASVLYRPGDDEVINVEEIVPLPQDFYQKLYSHQELSALSNSRPNNVVIIHKYNLESLQEQIIGLDNTYLDNYVLNYGNFLVVYDYDGDELRSVLPLNQNNLPQDFFETLLKHPELKGYENQRPDGGRLDEASLNELKTSYPDIYQNAEVGDYVVRYPKKLLIYNYERDVIKDTFTLQ